MVFQRRSRWVGVVLYGLTALLGLSGVIAATTLLGHVAGGLLAAGAVYLGFRQARIAVILTHEEVILRNAFRTHRVHWTDIEAVRKPGPFGYGVARRRGGVLFTLRDGRRLCADAYVKAAWDGEIGEDLVSAVQAGIATRTPAVSE